MRIAARPSKTFFYEHFERDMLCSAGKEWGADIACANLKNLRFFKTRKYLGIDIDASKLQVPDSAGQLPEVHTKACDIRRLDLENGSIDFVVSTHTLSHLQRDDRLLVVASLVRIVADGGSLLLTIPYAAEQYADMCTMLRGAFGSAHIIRYRNRLTQWYEKVMAAPDGRLTFADHRRNISPKTLRKMSVWLAKIEGRPAFQWGMNMVYVFAQQKQR